MKIKTLIKKLQKIEAKHGNLHVFGTNFQLIVNAKYYSNNDDEFPKDWNMPKAYCVVED